MIKRQVITRQIYDARLTPARLNRLIKAFSSCLLMDSRLSEPQINPIVGVALEGIRVVSDSIAIWPLADVRYSYLANEVTANTLERETGIP